MSVFSRAKKSIQKTAQSALSPYPSAAEGPTMGQSADAASEHASDTPLLDAASQQAPAAPSAGGGKGLGGQLLGHAGKAANKLGAKASGAVRAATEVAGAGAHAAGSTAGALRDRLSGGPRAPQRPEAVDRLPLDEDRAARRRYGHETMAEFYAAPENRADYARAKSLFMGIRAMSVFKPERSARLQAEYGLTEEEIGVINIYTTNAAYPINAALRGSGPVGERVGLAPYLDIFESAYPKLPKGAMKESIVKGTKPADGEEDKILKTDTAYRADSFHADPPSFRGWFLNNWNVGGTLTDPGFYSVAFKKGAYEHPNGTDVRTTITGIGEAAASVADLSESAIETEMLLPPGSTLRLTSLINTTTGEKVSNPKKDYTEADLDSAKFEAKAELVSVGGGQQGSAKPAADAG